MNQQHKNIKFNLDKEQDKKLPFLDVLITKNSKSKTLTTSIFHKKTYTGLLFNFFSITPQTYKTGLIKILLHRIKKINNTQTSYQRDLNEFIDILKRNSYS